MTEALARNPGMRRLGLELAVVGAALLALYFPVLRELVADWNANPNFSHGYLIPVIAGAMVYARRKELAALEPGSSLWGVAVVVLGLGQYVVAHVAAEYFLQRSSLVVVLFGVSLFLGGRDFVRLVRFPILYLLLMIPVPAVIWNRVALPMQLFASRVTEWVIRMVGMPVLREGNVLELPQTTLEVVDACSGLRSLTTMLALALALVYFCRLPPARRMGIILSAFPIAILVNVFRLVVTAFMASRFGGKVAQGFLHVFSGWLTFVLGLAMLWAVTELLTRKPKKSDNHA